MSLCRTQPVSVCALVATVCALAAGGCANWQLPRIDPTGERFFIMPGEPPPPYTGPVAPGALQAPTVPPPPPIAATAPPVGAVPMVGAPPTSPPPLGAPSTIITTPVAPPPIGMPSGNLQAAPVYPDAGLTPTPNTAFGAPSAPPPSGSPPLNLPPPTPIPPTVDARWAIPASTTAEGGRALVLTSIVSRRSDGAPLAGWTVRYEVSGAAVGGSNAGFIDVPTDASGRASVEVAPNDPGGGTAILTTNLIPPAAPGAAPVVIARGTSMVQWSPAPPPPPMLETPTPTSPPPFAPTPPSPIDRRPSLPPDTPSSGRYGQPASPPSSGSGSTFSTPSPPPKPPGTPRLEVRIRTTSPDPVTVGEFARFEVTVTNRGDGPARGIKVLDRFDRGLAHPKSPPGELAVKYENMRDLPAGEFDTVPLTFEVKSAGRLCHNVTVTAEGAAAANASACITAIDPAPAAPPSLEVTKQGPTRQYVGEVARFKAIVKNSGQVPVTNVEIVDQYDPALDPVADPGAEERGRGTLVWRIDRLEVGERREFNVQCACVAPKSSACAMVRVTADGGLNLADQKCVEVLPVLPPGGRSLSVSPPVTAPQSGGLKVSFVESAGPARVGSPLILFLFIENTGTQIERDVRLRVSVPQELTPVESQIRPAGQFRIVGDREIQFNPLAELRPGEKRQFDLPVRVDRAGTVNLWAQIAAAGRAQPLTEQSPPIEILPAGN